MLQKTKGIVLHYIRYSESSIVAHMYTDLFGRQSFICSGIKGKNSKHRLVYFQPLSLVEMDVYAKQKSELYRIKEIKNDHPLYHITGDMVKSSIALFLSELLYKTLNEGEPNPRLFSFLHSSVQLLENLDEGVSNFHLVFIIQLSKHLGIFPQADFEDMSGTTRSSKNDFASEERFFTSFSQKIKEKFGQIYTLSFRQISEIKLNHAERAEMLGYLMEFYKLHFNSLGSIKSLAVLQELFK
jgi:DNA repair protein RecO (recombination protein O)